MEFLADFLDDDVVMKIKTPRKVFSFKRLCKPRDCLVCKMIHLVMPYYHGLDTFFRARKHFNWNDAVPLLRKTFNDKRSAALIKQLVPVVGKGNRSVFVYHPTPYDISVYV